MEIKKGISQMAEYPNVEINYVMPKDGRMYYVLKDGILANGCIIATLDPKYAIDENNLSTSVGVFSEAGEVLIDFDKKSIRSISDDLVLVENTKLSTPEVIGVFGKETDPSVSQMVNEAKENIEMRIKGQMSPSGELLFADPYKEANVYRLDSYNHKLGMDCSFIGKDETGLFFHTNDIGGQIQIIELDDFKADENIVVENLEEENEGEDLKLDINNDILSGFNIPAEDLEKMKDQEENKEDAPSSVEQEPLPQEQEQEVEENQETELEPEAEEIEENSDEEEIEEDEDDNSEDSSGEVSLNIIDEDTEESDLEEEEEDEEESMEKSRPKSKNSKVKNRKRDIDLDIDMDEEEESYEDDEVEESSENRGNYRKNKSKNADKEEVLDHAIEVINKLIKETNKLKRKISLLEEQLQEKNEIIQESENKKDELNDILDKANEVLQRIR